VSEVGAHIIARGLVQGVGFRWFVHKHAAGLDLRGQVKNLADDSVDIIVEGDRSLIEELIKIVKVGPRSAQVSDMVIEWQEPSGKYSGFIIKG
jgi:acylphosphatase